MLKILLKWALVVLSEFFHVVGVGELPWYAKFNRIRTQMAIPCRLKVVDHPSGRIIDVGGE